ncbi:platelet-activating factor acetylhydrolase IB subunit alpha2-like [Paramacrobiotus metropolitanus]|uniref:platelet-activating factor acetylhydrolase IB subunit alpha2-like n=1 Tax=Paramacrobiotus metropolitanus TaxID=2943436 RepID=UPI00244581DC|nr:platelet-activating factor acetylhydrolase IB subunit alpha2-like [Paramacrobiotus metropolitanus]
MVQVRIVLSLFKFGDGWTDCGGTTAGSCQWRIAAIDNFHAKAIVLLIGTNNIQNTPDHIAGMIEKIIQALRDRQPSTQIFVIELFPKGPGPSVYREKNKAVNELLRERLKEETNIRVINLDPGFVDGNGQISRTDLPDYLHFSHIAYEKAFSPLFVLLDEAVRNQARNDSIHCHTI